MYLLTDINNRHDKIYVQYIVYILYTLNFETTHSQYLECKNISIFIVVVDYFHNMRCNTIATDLSIR